MSGAAHVSNGPHFVVTIAGEIHGEDTPENRDLVRRIHACVAACEGITTDELERGVVQDMRRVIGEVAPLLQARVQTPLATSAAKPSLMMMSEPRTSCCSMRDSC